MNKKGFTLIELLGSIVILAIISVIAFPAILSLLSNSQKHLDDKSIQLVESAAKEYVNDNVNSYPKTSGFSAIIKVDDLIKEGYITITNIKDNDDIKDSCVLVEADDLNYNFTYQSKDRC